MGRPWCDGLPVVTVPSSTAPKRVTMVVPYYENAQWVSTLVDVFWPRLPAPLLEYFTTILVDDGSPVPLPRLAAAFRIRQFRIDVDVRWNWLAARNIGAHHAADEWLLLTDIDHVLPPETLSALIWGAHDPAVVYAFRRVEHTGASLVPHSASFFLTRAQFWAIGGYDEALSGHYGTDGDFRRRVAAVAPIQVLTDFLVRYEHCGDSSTTRYQRKQPQDAAVKSLIARRRPGWRPRTLSFPYHEVTPC